MPGKKKGKKAGGKKKSKKSGKSGKKSSKSILKESKSSSSVARFDNRPPLLRPGEKLVDLLKTHPVDEKEINGIKISSRVLEQLTAQDIRDLHIVFEIFDANSDGRIGPLDLRKVLRTLGFKVKKDEVSKMVQDANVNAKNEIDFNEFLEIIIDKQGDTRDVYEDIIKGFKMFDFDSAGSISLEKLKRACNLAGIKFTQKELEEMLEEADLNGDGAVDQTEFIQIMLQTNLF